MKEKGASQKKIRQTKRRKNLRNTENKATRKWEEEEEDGVRKDLCMCAREVEEACKTERGYPASQPRCSCYVRLCPLTRRVHRTHGRIPDHDTHMGQLTVVVDKHNNKAINVLFAHKILRRQADTYNVWLPYLSHSCTCEWDREFVPQRHLFGGRTQLCWCIAWLTFVSIWAIQPLKRYPW